MTQARSGRDASDVTLESLRRGELTADDVRIHPDTLEHQAQVAEQHANPQLAANLRRAAELTALPDDEVHRALVALKGVGPWSASIYLIEALLRPDVWPASDIALAEAVAKVKGLPGRPDPARLDALAQAWRPWSPASTSATRRRRWWSRTST